MTNSRWPLRLSLALLAVALPAAGLHFAAPDERLAAGLTAAPFARPRLLVAHFAAALPLALILAGWAAAQARYAARAAIAGAVAVGLAAALPGLADALEPAGFVPHAVARAAHAVALVAALLVLWGVGVPAPGRAAWGVAAAAALLPPGLYAYRAAANRAADFQTYAAANRLTRAAGALDELADLDPNRGLGKKTAAEYRALLTRDTAKLTKAVATPLPELAPPAARRLRAIQFLALGRHAEATAALDGLPLADADVALTRLAVARDADDLAAVESLAAAVFALDPPAPPAVLAAAYEAQGEAYRKARRPDDAAATYRAAAARLPDRAGHFELQLGLLADARSRHRDALAHFESAVRLAPDLAAQVAPLADRVRRDSPSCVLPR